jgi:hypothetical protein
MNAPAELLKAEYVYSDCLGTRFERDTLASHPGSGRRAAAQVLQAQPLRVLEHEPVIFCSHRDVGTLLALFAGASACLRARTACMCVRSTVLARARDSQLSKQVRLRSSSGWCASRRECLFWQDGLADVVRESVEHGNARPDGRGLACIYLEYVEHRAIPRLVQDGDVGLAPGRHALRIPEPADRGRSLCALDAERTCTHVASEIRLMRPRRILSPSYPVKYSVEPN